MTDRASAQARNAESIATFASGGRQDRDRYHVVPDGEIYRRRNVAYPITRPNPTPHNGHRPQSAGETDGRRIHGAQPARQGGGDLAAGSIAAASVCPSGGAAHS